jgi:DNA helicase-2/ATP-dependent DNA helicase PcrA
MYEYLDQLNPEQKAAVEHMGTPLLIMAGAGSGKTKTLTYKAAYLIHSSTITPEQLLMVTFTNKAAGEMKERLLKVGKRVPNGYISLYVCKDPQTRLPGSGTIT